MNALSCIANYSKKTQTSLLRPFAINLVTNFTDDTLERIFGGMCLEEGLYPTITRASYKQYVLELLDQRSALYQSKPDVTFVFFDAHVYAQNEFYSSSHRDEVLSQLENYCGAVTGPVIVSLCMVPYRSVYGHYVEEDPLFVALTQYNDAVRALAKKVPNLYVFDSNKVLHMVGEDRARDLRGAHAFDIPFTNDFFFALAQEWLAYVRALVGKSRKCIVLDLDNTLWGGVLGEEGPLGVQLGPQYPGIAYMEFQRTLRSLSERGVILAIASKNNIDDVKEIFEKNPHMLLTEDHFAAIRANWDKKSDNIKSIAQELNIGTDSMVFIDDSPLERAEVSQGVPDVLVPQWRAEPELFVQQLLGLAVFHQMALTTEDVQKTNMYAQERKRRIASSLSKNPEEYLAGLRISVKVAQGGSVDIARAAQLCQKTNQYTLTTKRYSEGDLVQMVGEGSLLYSGDVSDVFGGYGVTIFAIIKKEGQEAVLDTFLMSCRVMGRGVERAFLEYILADLSAQGILGVRAVFVPTAKNKPIATFLPENGFRILDQTTNEQVYELDLAMYAENLLGRAQSSTISIGI